MYIENLYFQKKSTMHKTTGFLQGCVLDHISFSNVYLLVGFSNGCPSSFHSFHFRQSLELTVYQTKVHRLSSSGFNRVIKARDSSRT